MRSNKNVKKGRKNMENYEISYVKNDVPQANIYIAESEDLAERYFKATRPDCLYAGIRKTNTVKPGQPVIEVPLWLLKISYSWGDEEADQKFCSFEDAWKAAKDMAINEAEITSMENDCEVGLSIDKNDTRQEGEIILHYTYDGTYCHYKVVKF